MARPATQPSAPAGFPFPVGQRLRRANDGQVGFLVEGEDGKPAVKLDRKAENLVFPYSAHMWKPDESGRLTPYHIATIAYAADTQLRHARGEYAVKEWRELPESVRIKWMASIPEDADAERKKLYAAVKGALA